MLESGHPPDDWNQLLNQAELEGHRLQRVFSTLGE
jgi:toxin YhaV